MQAMVDDGRRRRGLHLPPCDQAGARAVLTVVRLEQWPDDGTPRLGQPHPPIFNDSIQAAGSPTLEMVLGKVIVQGGGEDVNARLVSGGEAVPAGNL